MGNYPMGADKDNNAPYNNKSCETILISCEVEQVMRKKCYIEVPVDVDKDEDNNVSYEILKDIDLTSCFLQQHLSIRSLLTLIQSEFENGGESLSMKKNRHKFILKECDGWELVETNVEIQ